MVAIAFVFIVLGSHSSHDAPEARTALVIGNSGYSSSRLANPRNDARDLAEVLREVGFEIDLKIDQDRRSLTLAIRQFSERLKKRGCGGLIYYAGHGMQVGGANHLIPAGGKDRSVCPAPV